MMRKLVVTGLTVAAMVLGLAVTPAYAAEDVDPGFVATAVNCDAIMDDALPRPFDEYTLEDRPPSATDGGGRTLGFVWVDKRTDGQGWDVCVGWPGGDEPFPYQAIVKDNRADGHGAIAYVTFIPWGSTTRVRSYGARVDGVNNFLGYNYVKAKVSGFYVGVCIIASGVKSGCNDERGTD